MSSHRKMLALLIILFVGGYILVSSTSLLDQIDFGQEHENTNGTTYTETAVSFQIALVENNITADISEDTEASFKVEKIALNRSNGRYLIEPEREVTVEEIISHETITVAEEKVPDRSYDLISLEIGEVQGNIDGMKLTEGSLIVSEGYFAFNSSRSEHVFHVGFVQDMNQTELTKFPDDGER